MELTNGLDLKSKLETKHQFEIALILLVEGLRKTDLKFNRSLDYWQNRHR